MEIDGKQVGIRCFMGIYRPYRHIAWADEAGQELELAQARAPEDVSKELALLKCFQD